MAASRSLRSSARTASMASPPYPHFDADELYAWLLDGLGDVRARFRSSLGRAGHSRRVRGAGRRRRTRAADHGLRVSRRERYRFRVRCDRARLCADRVAQTSRGTQPWAAALLAAAKVSAGIRRATIVPYPQYWAARLCGVRAWEPTSLGCHTDLWDPQRGDFSSLRKDDAMGLAIWPPRERMDAARTAVAGGRRGDRSFATSAGFWQEYMTATRRTWRIALLARILSASFRPAPGSS